MEPQTDNLTLGNLVNRLTSPTPDFHKKVRAMAIKIGVAAAVVLAISAKMPNIVPPIMVTICKAITIAGATVSAYASTTKTPPTDDTQANQK